MFSETLSELWLAGVCSGDYRRAPLVAGAANFEVRPWPLGGSIVSAHVSLLFCPWCSCKDVYIVCRCEAPFKIGLFEVVLVGRFLSLPFEIIIA